MHWDWRIFDYAEIRNSEISIYNDFIKISWHKGQIMENAYNTYVTNKIKNFYE